MSSKTKLISVSPNAKAELTAFEIKGRGVTVNSLLDYVLEDFAKISGLHKTIFATSIRRQ
jgi:hypothetical protein